MLILPASVLAISMFLAPAEDPERLAAALQAIQETSLRSDLYFLADDEMGGRDTPSPQLMITAKFLATRLQRLGFASATGKAPAIPEDWYLTYPLHHRALDADHCKLELHSKDTQAELKLGEDYFLYRSTHAFNSSTEAPVVSAGNGTSEELEAAEIAGKWALVFDQGKSVRRIQRTAQKLGAAGLLLAQTSQSKHDYKTKYKKIIERATKGVTSLQAIERGMKSSGEIPLLLLSEVGLRRLIENDGLGANNLRVDVGVSLGLVLKETRINLQEEIPVPNVGGFWPGRDAELSKEVIIVSAHFDHVGMRDGEIYNGADDNASGTTGLLGIAEALKAYGPMRRSVLLLWVSGEEKGLWGSAAWTENPVLPEGYRPVADLNIDMIGRNAPDELYVTPTEDHPSYNAVSAAAYAMARLEGFPELKSQDDYWQRSDHYNFDQNLGIPVAFLSCGEHPDYHKPTDTADKIDFEKLARVSRTIVRLLDHIEDGVLE